MPSNNRRSLQSLYEIVLRALATAALLPAVILVQGCTTVSQSATFGQDWIPPSFTEPAEDRTGFHLGVLVDASDTHTSSDDLLHYGGRAGVEACMSGAFTETLGWNVSGAASGFLFFSGESLDCDSQKLMSYGGTAQASAAFVIGRGIPVWFCIGPEIVYSMERGPFYDWRDAASRAESDPIANLSPNGNTLAAQGNMRLIWKVREIGKMSAGISAGFYDPDFPNNMFSSDGDNLEFVEYASWDFQGAAYRIFCSVCFGAGPEISVGFILGTELFLIR